MPSQEGLGFNMGILEGHKHSVYNTQHPENSTDFGAVSPRQVI